MPVVLCLHSNLLPCFFLFSMGPIFLSCWWKTEKVMRKVLAEGKAMYSTLLHFTCHFLWYTPHIMRQITKSFHLSVYLQLHLCSSNLATFSMQAQGQFTLQCCHSCLNSQVKRTVFIRQGVDVVENVVVDMPLDRSVPCVCSILWFPPHYTERSWRMAEGASHLCRGRLARKSQFSKGPICSFTWQRITLFSKGCPHHPNIPFSCKWQVESPRKSFVLLKNVV